MLSVVLAIAIVVAVAVYDYAIVAGRWRGLGPWPPVVVAFGLSQLFEPSLVFHRCIACVWGMAIAARSFECATGRVREREMLRSPLRFVVWLLMPAESRPPRDAAEALALRRRGRLRFARGVIKLPFILALLAVEARWPELHEGVWLESFWALWLTWLAVSGLSDLITPIGLHTGVVVDENFDAPMLARSPREFWGRRWNRFVHRFATRHLFVALGGRRRPGLATLIVFTASGLVHEIFVVLVLGHLPQRVGWMTAFFVVQGLAVVGQVAVRRRRGRKPVLPRALAVALHLLWISATAPLFFGPLGEIFAGW